MKYEAFISYRHGGIDGKVAVSVQQTIEKYHIPGGIAKNIGRKHVGRVFRDEDELQAGNDLSALIREGIDESEWLIVIATRRYRESVWCLEEIEYFLKTKGREKIIVILADGEPAESFPQALTEVERDGELVSIEPLAVDVREADDKAVLKRLHQERFRFLSTLLSVSYEDLRQRQRERRLKRIGAMIGTAFLLLAVVTGVIIYKNVQLNHAYTALDQSNRETLKGESYYLSEYADEALAGGDRKTAAMLSLEALPEDSSENDRPYVPRAVRSLTRALGVYDYTAGCRTGPFFDMRGETYDVRTQISEDGSRILIESFYYAAGNILDREVMICTMDGTELLRLKESSINRGAYHQGSMGSTMSRDGKRLIYLAPEGIRCIEIDTGREIYTGETASELLIGSSEKVIATIDYERGRLVTYNEKGEDVIGCDLGKEMNYTLEAISPDESFVALSAKTESIFGIITIRLKDGKSGFIDMAGVCSYVRCLDNKRLCFLLSDPDDGLKHIVKYDLEIGDEGYLCNADWDMQTMTLTDQDTCYYYHENRVYEVDCNSAKGKKVWDYSFPSRVVSVGYGDDRTVVTCQDGSITCFDEKSKRRIFSDSGNGKPLYVLGVRSDSIALRDYWGRTVRIFEKNEKTDESVPYMTLEAAETAPEKWYNYSGTENRFAMGFHNGAKDSLSVFDAGELIRLSGADMAELDYESLENKSIDIRNGSYLSVQDFDTYSIGHYRTQDMKKTMSFNEDGYYYYNENGTTLCLSENGKLKVYEAATGEVKAEETIPASMDRGVKIGDRYVFGNADSVEIREAGADSGIKIPQVVLYAYNEARGLIATRDPEEKTWQIYRVEDQQLLCEGESGIYSCAIFFGGNKYFLNDYKVVYDMDSWEPVLDVSDISNSVYGVMTCDNLPFFVVWCQGEESESEGRSSGGSKAYLYEKGGNGEIVGDIPGFITLTEEGEAIVFDGEKCLYRIPLLSVQDVIQRGKTLVGGEEFTAYQKEKYHLYG